MSQETWLAPAARDQRRHDKPRISKEADVSPQSLAFLGAEEASNGIATTWQVACGNFSFVEGLARAWPNKGFGSKSLGLPAPELLS